MFKSYLKIGFRKLRRNKLYAVLNIVGLSLGLATFLIIYFFVQNELSFDQYHKNADKLYRITASNTIGEVSTYAGTSAALVKPIAEQIPEIEALSLIESWKKNIVFMGLEDSVARLDNISVDQAFFEMFDLPLTSGTSPDYDSNPNVVLVSESLAELKWSGDAIGKTIKVRSELFEVSGIYQDFPKNSSIQGDLIFEIKAVNQWRKDSFTNVYLSYRDQLYFMLPEGTKSQLVAQKVEKIFNDMRGAQVEPSSIDLQPLKDIHFDTTVEDAFGRKTDMDMIFIFSAIAFFILLCSFFNYVSMAVSESLEKTREIGVRKVMGAGQFRLYVDYLFESLFLITIAMVLALVLVEALTPGLESLLERELDNTIKYSGELWGYAIVFIVSMTSLSALYPTLLSGSSRISDLLKNSTVGLKSIKWINAISVFQIMVFMTLISFAFVANRQLKFMQNENLGFQKDNILVIPAFQSALSKHAQVLENEFLKIPEVKSITRARSMPGRIMGTMGVQGYNELEFYNFPIALNYFETMGMTVTQGRTYRASDIDKTNVILNETAIKAMEIKGDPIGKTFTTFNRDWTIVGVVNDFHAMSKKEPIKPTFFRFLGSNEDKGVMLINMDGENLRSTMASLQDVYEEISGAVMPYSFLNESFDRLYKEEQTIITIIQAGTTMAAIIALLGLFGITGFAAKRRIKEMGIRKVLGASFMNIQASLNRSNLVKLFIAACISIPLIYYWLNEWLNSFAYHIEFPVLLVLGTLILAAAVSLSTAIYHSIKAYLINPVEILKDE